MKKKLPLKNLEVKSFITTLNKHSKQTLDGGTAPAAAAATPIPGVGQAVSIALLGSAIVALSVNMFQDSHVWGSDCDQPDTLFDLKCKTDIKPCADAKTPVPAVPAVFQGSDPCMDSQKCKRCY